MLMSPIFSSIKVAHVHNPRNLNPNLKFLYKKTLSHISTRFHLCTVSVAMSSASVKIVAEYAKSGRSSCKKCSKSIASSSLRLGLVSKDPRGFDMTKWHHFNCFPFTDSNPISSAEAITGFSSLKVKHFQFFGRELCFPEHEANLVVAWVFLRELFHIFYFYFLDFHPFCPFNL